MSTQQNISSKLDARVGGIPGAVLRIKGAQVEGEKEDSVRAGIIPAGWTEIAVLASVPGEGARFFLLQPGDGAGDIGVGGLYVRGPFRIVKTINNERKARDAFSIYVTANVPAPAAS